MTHESSTSETQRLLCEADAAQPHPVYCIWELTLRCDLGCKHCGSRAGAARKQELTTQECLRVVEQLVALGVREVILIGGEAYLRPDWTTIARALTDGGIRCGMTTGARQLTTERVQQAVDAGLRTISISIDGCEATHDAQRGVKGSWRAAKEAALRVAATPMQLSINTQINRLSMPELPAVADFLVAWGAEAWQIQLTVAMGRAADRPDLLLQPYELLTLFPKLVQIKKETLTPHGIQLCPANNIGYFGPYERWIRLGGEQGMHWTGCPAGLWALGLEADGTVKGCPSLPTQPYSGGNILELELASIVSESTALRSLRERTIDDLWGFCRTCYFAETCRAGCSWTTHSLLGRPGNNPYCIHRAMTLDKEGKRERIVKVEDAPGNPFDHGRFSLLQEPKETPHPPPLSRPFLDEDPQQPTHAWTPEELQHILRK